MIYLYIYIFPYIYIYIYTCLHIYIYILLYRVHLLCCDRHMFFVACKVLHLRDQINAGLGVADRFMEKRMLMLCGEKGLQDSLTGFARRVLAEAGQRFPDVHMDQIHHIGFLDTTKFGRLSMPEIDAMACWAQKVLNLNPDRSILLFPIWLDI